MYFSPVDYLLHCSIHIYNHSKTFAQPFHVWDSTQIHPFSKCQLACVNFPWNFISPRSVWHPKLLKMTQNLQLPFPLFLLCSAGCRTPCSLPGHWISTPPENHNSIGESLWPGALCCQVCQTNTSPEITASENVGQTLTISTITTLFGSCSAQFS